MAKGGFYSRAEIAQLVQNLETPNIAPFRVPGRGKVFFVDGTIGSDNNDGDDPNRPLATKLAAYNKCVDKRGDYIIVLGPRSIVGVNVVTPTLTLAKANIHIIGIGSGNFDSDNDWDGGALPSIIFAEGSRELELAGFNLGNDGSDQIITATGQVNRLHIHHCTLGWAGHAGTNGIGFTAGGALNLVEIDHNWFGYGLSNISIGNYMSTARIHHNTFFMPGVACIRAIDWALGHFIEIFENKFFSPVAAALSAGWAVTLDANTFKCWVMHNWAAACADGTGNNPYGDATGAVGAMLNGWAENYDGSNAIVPPDAL